MTSIDQFMAGVAEVRTLLSLCTPDDDGGAHHDARNNAVYRASTVLLVSHFESFVKSVAEDFMDAIAIGDVASKAIPVGIREVHSLPRMEEILSCGDATQRLALLRKITDYSCLWIAEAKPPRGLLKAAVLSGKVTSADNEVLDAVFALMGTASPVCDGEVDVILSNDGTSTPVNIRLMLRDVVKCRNDIAHGDVTRIPTTEDVDRYIRQLQALARRLEARATQLATAVVT